MLARIENDLTSAENELLQPLENYNLLAPLQQQMSELSYAFQNWSLSYDIPKDNSQASYSSLSLNLIDKEENLPMVE